MSCSRSLFASSVVVLAGAASADDTAPARSGRLGAIELTTILGLVGSVLTLLVVSQLVALTDAGDRLIESAGLIGGGVCTQRFLPALLGHRTSARVPGPRTVAFTRSLPLVGMLVTFGILVVGHSAARAAVRGIGNDLAGLRVRLAGRS